MFSLKEISIIINGKIEKKHQNLIIDNVCDIEIGKENCITFLKNNKYEKYLLTNKASAIIVNKNFNLKNYKKPLVIVDDPSLSFIKILKLYKAKLTTQKNKGKISKTANISSEANIGNNVIIGANVVIEDNVIINDNVIIYANSYIGERSIIGENTIIYANVSIYDNSKIGQNCKIQSGAIIGSEGFGIIKNKEGNYDIPHVGSVKLGNNVTVGSNSCIYRGTINDTQIEDNVKIDNLVQIGHNALIGKGCLLSAQVGIAGSSKLGKNVTMAGQSGVIDHITIGDNSIVAVKSCVFKSIDKNSFVSGNPAIDHKKRLKNEIIFNRLSDKK